MGAVEGNKYWLFAVWQRLLSRWSASSSSHDWNFQEFHPFRCHSIRWWSHIGSWVHSDRLRHPWASWTNTRHIAEEPCIHSNLYCFRSTTPTSKPPGFSSSHVVRIPIAAEELFVIQIAENGRLNDLHCFHRLSDSQWSEPNEPYGHF